MSFLSGSVESIKGFRDGEMFSTEFIGSNSWNGYEHNCLFSNLGDGGKFVDIGRPAGVDCVKDCRGVAIADIDGDGWLDIVINNNAETPTIYINDNPQIGKAHWLNVKLVASNGSPDAIGAVARLRLIDEDTGEEHTLARFVKAGSGYASQSPMPLHFGLGTRKWKSMRLEISWPDGSKKELGNTELEQLIDQPGAVVKQ